MADISSLTIKRPITVRAVVTPTWKEEAEREISNGIAAADQQLAQLEQEGQQVVEQVRRQSANPLDPRVQEQVANIQHVLPKSNGGNHGAERMQMVATHSRPSKNIVVVIDATILPPH